jgi:hypothetical protein
MIARKRNIEVTVITAIPPEGSEVFTVAVAISQRSEGTQWGSGGVDGQS